MTSDACADVPDHRAGGVEIGRPDEQRAAPQVLSGDFGDDGVVDILLDQPAIAARIGDGAAAGQRGKDRFRRKLTGPVGRVDLGHLVIVVRAQEGEHGDDRAGRYSGDRSEFRAVSPRCPAIQ
jgi:hypothetical protein